MDLYNDLEELCELTSEKIADANEKLRANQSKLTAGDLEYLDKLTHMLKSIKTTMAMMDADDNHSSLGRNSYNYYDGGMSRRGRSYEGGSSRRGYSGRMYRDTGMISELRNLMQQTDDEHTKQEFQRLIEKMEHM